MNIPPGRYYKLKSLKVNIKETNDFGYDKIIRKIGV
jgi:hypothetical protein